MPRSPCSPRVRRASCTPERRLEIGDYLLGQQPGVAERLKTRTYLSGSQPARAWANEIAAQLAPLAGAGLPEVPAGAGARGLQRVGDLSSSASSSVQAGGAGAGGVGAAQPARSLPSSRVGGAALLAVIAAAVIVAVVLLTSGGSHAKKTATTAASKTSSAATAATKTGPTVENQIALKSPDPRSRSAGAIDVLAEGDKRAFFIEARNIPAAKGFYYAVWLYNSPTSSLPLSKSSAVGSTHRLAGGSLLPSNAGAFHEILLTRETNPHPTHPGHVVLRGPFSLSG